MKWVIDNKDVVLLAAYLGEDTLIGVDDPFLGWLAEQVEEQWPITIQALIQEGFAVSEGNDKLLVQLQLKEAIVLCCRPRRFISINIYGDSIPVKISYNIAEKKYATVESKGSSVTIILDEYTRESLRKSVSDMLMLPANAGIFFESGEVSKLPATFFTDESDAENDLDSKIRDMVVKPNKKMFVILGDFCPGGKGLRTFGVFIKNDHIIQVEETDDGELKLRSVKAEDVLSEIIG